MNDYQMVSDVLGCIIGIFYIVILFKSLWKSNTTSAPLRLLLYTTTGGFMFLAITIFRNTSFATILISFAIFLNTLAFRATTFARIYYSFIAMIVSTSGELFAILIIRGITHDTIEVLQADPYLYFITSMLSNAMQVLLVTIFIFAFKRYMKFVPKGKAVLILLPISTIFMTVLILVLIENGKAIDMALYVFVGVAVLIITNISILSVMEEKFDTEQEHSALVTTRERLDKQICYSSQLASGIESAYKVTHDMKNILIALTGLIRENQTEKAVDYIETLLGKVASSIQVVSTGHPSLDAVLQSKLTDAYKCHAKLNIKISMPNRLYVDELDLSKVISNALDNAIREMQNLREEDRIISLVIYYKYDFLSISVVNPTYRNVDVNFLKSSKPGSGHGYGIKIIQEIAARYHGAVTVRCDDNQFRLSVLLVNKAD